MSRSGSIHNLIDLVSTEIGNSALPVKDTPVIAAVSGGADSMVLLWILAVAMRLNVIAVHINYGKRAEDSGKDEELVRHFCGRHNIRFETYRDSGKENFGNEEKASGNFQEYARDLRREVLLSVMKQYQACAIFLAHHDDDQTETIFQKILRGAAPEKWAGMSPADPPWYRPLLHVTKGELLAFAGDHAIPYRTDATNLESVYTRNILRNELFPILDKAFPGWRRNIRNVARAGRRQREMLDHVTDQVAIPYTGTGTSHQSDMDRAAWMALPPGLRIPVARHWIAQQTGYTGWSKGEVERLADLAHIPTGGRITLDPDIAIIRDRDRFVVAGDSGKSMTRILNLSDLARTGTTHAGIQFAIDHYASKRKGTDLQLALNSLPEELLLRNWTEGDRIHPLGMEGSQSVADHLTNRKVSSAQKKSTLVLVSFDGKVHAIIFPHCPDSGEMGTIAEQSRCRTEGQPVLLIKQPDHHP
ncbi:MAG: tRNA lysidine(34) synthetase TilS [Balneolaceae bacterium]|nr:MAG: tRNA lysidine(34) synthetase TilS [Balneolaceae bacterium]